MQSPYMHLLNSGLPPAEADVPLIHDLIAKARTRAATLDGQIAAMEAALAKLASEKDDVIAFALAHEVIVSPHSYYPAEILCEIFRHTVEMTGDPWLLGKICRRWRKLSASFPPIWSTISINLFPRPPSYKPNPRLWPVVRAETHLARAAGCPLTVTFLDMRSPSEGPEFDWIRDLTSVLVSASERWETAHIYIFPEHYAFLDVARGRLPSLKSLTLHGIYNSETPLDMFSVAPSLWKLTLNGCLSNPTTRFALPWGQISDYTADSEYNHDHFPVLPRLTSVVEARLTLENLAPTTHEDPQQNSALRRLYVNRGSILDLDLPELEELTLEPLNREPAQDEDPLANLVTFLARSSPPLTKLCLIGFEFTDALLVDVLRQTPALVDLCIQSRHRRSVPTATLAAVVDFLHVGEETHLLALQTLTFGEYRFADYLKLAEMVESRSRRASCPLTSFGLISRQSLDISELAAAKFETLRNEGLTVLFVEGEGAKEALLSLPFFAIAYTLENPDYAMWHW
ncbi:hypothetical protein FB451DRAFT_1104204 [Mycena latifolia]|nr:hypothetical protein FB451DRAFT_1104204 [Mycena latifolia]